MSPTMHLYSADTDGLFDVVGSADRDVLRRIGMAQGDEFLLPSDDDEDFDPLDDEIEENDWNPDDEEDGAARETIVNMVMGGMPPDPSETEAAAIQAFFASYAVTMSDVDALDADDIVDALPQDLPIAIVRRVRDLIVKGLDHSDLMDCFEWLEESDASTDLRARMQLLCLGRLPESDEPSFHDDEEALDSVRFSYLSALEMRQSAEELAEMALTDMEEMGALPLALSAAFRYCATHSLDLVVTVQD